MKRILLFLAVAVLVLTGCVQTKTDVANDKKDGDTKAGGVDLELLGMASQEQDMNIVRDQLVKNGFNVKLNIQPDYGSYTAQKEAGNYDVMVSGWTTVTGNPDYAVRGLFKTDGDYSITADSQLDALIDEASMLTGKEMVAKYKELEERLVFDQAHIAPLYVSNKYQGIYSEVVDKDSVRLPKSRAQVWEDITFKDAALNSTQPLILQQGNGTLTSLDPIKGNDGSINTLNTNMYVRLVNLTDDDKVVADGSLSYNYAMTEDKSSYYFVLRDDINFAAVKEGKAMDTGELVSGEDAVFSLQRAKNKDSVPDHRTYSLHEHIDTVALVSDIAELEKAKAEAGGDVLTVLSKDLPTPIKKLVTNKAEVNNKEGAYEVVKITTPTPFPQVLNYLAHQSAGIVSEKQVTAINTYDVANYNPDKDVAYGDQSTIIEGAATYNNQLYASGPYILVGKNDYEGKFVKNPAYRTGTEHSPKIDAINVRFIEDEDSSLSALRNGEIHILQTVPETKLDIVKNDKKLTLNTADSNAMSYLMMNPKDRAVSDSVDLRKAILYSINEDDIISYYQGNKKPAISTLSPLVDTGLTLQADPAKVKEYLTKYQAEK